MIFNPNFISQKDLMLYPNFINKDIKTFWETVGKNEIIVSRSRETGIKFSYHNETYNIDIDFLWQMYLSLFSSEEKVVICSNHQLYQLFMVSLLENCFRNNGKTICLATPYLNVENQLECSLEKRLLSTKLVALLSLKWAKKEEQNRNTTRHREFIAISPDGVVTQHLYQNEFARQMGWNTGRVNELLKGVKKSYKGWKLEYVK